MADLKRLIFEEGIILSKEYIPAKDAWTNREGITIDARPAKYVVRCVSGQEIKQDLGFVNPTFNEYEVEKEFFEQLKFNQKVLCKFEFSKYGVKPLGLSIK